jgi:hypothetical protein
MPASLTRSSRIKSLLPLALAQGWTVRQLATSARISHASACQHLKVAAQRAETVLDADTGAVYAPLAHQLRESVTVAAEKLLARVDTLADTVESAADAERLARALETAARLADNLDGLAHARSLEKEQMRGGGQERPIGVSIPALSGYLPNLDACAPTR